VGCVRFFEVAGQKEGKKREGGRGGNLMILLWHQKKERGGEQRVRKIAALVVAVTLF